MLNIIQDLIPQGRRNRPGRANSMTHITIHNTGNPARTAGARNHAAYLKAGAADVPVSWHYTTDDKEVIRHLPDNELGFHAGSRGNPVSVGIEICMNEGGDLLRATDHAVSLTAMLCKKYNIPVANIVQHHHWTGKICPQMIRAGRPYSWETFLQKVRAAMAPPPLPAMKDTPSAWAAAACHKAVRSGLVAGDGQGRFGWRDPVTLEQLIVLLDKAGGMGWPHIAL
jgi:N-acetylmuramoyl-L-alanine amidase